ncbi:MAG: RHS repeat-associated core domain-containing protein, partial [Flavobacterium sp.]|nr:RHS repeat-associated core domain-containing protein [Flavobacterium sp.]
MTGDKRYELSNHLGNVLVVINDKKIPEFEKPDMPETGLVAFNADVLSYSDYYPFGMLQDARHGSKANYRYGFNGKEKDDELKGEGNSYDYGFRMYDPRTARFFSVDPLTESYPELTPYQFASNTPIQAIDLDGLERLDVVGYDKEKREVRIKIVKNVYISKSISVEAYKTLNTSKFSEIFKAGNRSIYTKELPRNNSTVEFITKDVFDSGSGFELKIDYDVKLIYTESQPLLEKDVAKSIVRVGDLMDFASSSVAANANVSSNTSEFYTNINPNYF